MENRVSLSNYFGSEEASGGRFFDEITSPTNPVDMTQSVNLQDGDSNDMVTAASALFPAPELPVPAVPSTFSAAVLPDPATFFDTITPDLQVAASPSAPRLSSDFLAHSLERLNVKESEVSTELDRRRDAWIPSEETRHHLLKAQSAPSGSYVPDRDVLTMPGIVLEEELPDRLQEAALRYLGVGEASTRAALRPSNVTRDEAGVRELLRVGHLRTALSLTAILLSALGQGVASLGRPSRHTPRSLQLWLTRFAIMARLRLRAASLQEAEAFGDLSRPDMFYQFYPETYGARTGSLAPFSLRLLLAELPLHAGDPNASLDNIYALLAVVRKMLRNLRAGLTEDGSGPLGEQECSESLKLWTVRETRAEHSLVNCAVALKDYRLAIETTARMAAAAPDDSRARPLYSALCRLCLHAGHVRQAESYLGTATEIRQRLCPTPDVREYVDRGLLGVAQGRYQEACGDLARAADQAPTDVTIANNTAVCLLYSGRLKEAIAVLHKAIAADPVRGLSESVLLNLCTLYELESSQTRDKKLGLLRQLCKYRRDTLPDIECLKLS